MNSTKLIETLTNWKKSIDSQILGFQDQKNVLDEAIQILTTGYETDQARIDTAVQEDIRARSQHITSLEDKVKEYETTIENLTQEKGELQIKKETLTKVVTTISDAIEEALPTENISA